MIRYIICTATSPSLAFDLVLFMTTKNHTKLPELRYPDRQLWSKKAEHWRASCRVNRFSRWWKVVGLVLWEHFDAPVLFVSKKSKVWWTLEKNIWPRLSTIDWKHKCWWKQSCVLGMLLGLGKTEKQLAVFLNMYQTGDPTYKMGPKSS